MFDVYESIKHLLFTLPPEKTHDLAVWFLEKTQNSLLQELVENITRYRHPKLRQSLWGRRFPNPVGLASGFDKNGRIPPAMDGLGFGHVEIGGVTARPQPGNPRPRLFRLIEDKALINRMGFNNEGADRIAERLDSLSLPDIPLGVNIGKSKVTPLDEAEDDYAYTLERLKEFGDYFVINVSSPNTPGLRSLQQQAQLSRILERMKSIGVYPLLVKISPDLDYEVLDSIVELSEKYDVNGLVATNTTIERPGTLRAENQTKEGGLSGQPLKNHSTDLVRFLALRANCPIIGVGGIFTAEDAYEKIVNGARLVQLYTGLVYEGPTIARDINRGLVKKLEQDGFDSIREAVGAKLD